MLSWKSCFSVNLAFLVVSSVLSFARASGSSGISVNMKVRDSSKTLINASSVDVRVMILSELQNGLSCVLKDETFQSTNISNGYLSLVVGSGVRGVYDPNIDLANIFLNSTTFSGLFCLDNGGVPSGIQQTYSPSESDGRRFRVSFTYAGENVVVEFRNKSLPMSLVSEMAKNSLKLGGKSVSDFVQIPSGQPNYQSRVNDLVSDSGNAIMSQILGGTYALPSTRVTGLGALATMTVTGTPSASTYLRGDGTWATVSGGGGGSVTSVSGTAPISVSNGTTTPAISISDATTSAKGAVQVGSGLSVASGVVSLPDTGTAGTYGSNYQVPVITTDAKGRVTGVTVSSITINGSAITAGTIDEARIPSLDASKIGAGTIAKARLPSDIVYNGGTSAVGIGSAAVGSALLSVTSTSSGFLMPRMTASQRDGITSPATGLQVYNTDSNQINYYNGSSWQALGVAGAGISSLIAGTGLTGGTITTSGTIAVDVGTTANKIVQLDGSARLPAVDASQVIGLTSLQIPSLDAAKITTGVFTASQIPSLDWSKITTGKPTTISGYGITNAVTNAGSVISMQSGLDASKGSATTAGRLYVATDTSKVYFDDGTQWVQVASNTGTTYTAGTGLSLSSGTFSISTVPVANGGTGATTPTGARTNLGITATGDSLVTAASSSAARTSLGLGTASTLNTGVASGNVAVIGVSGITNNKLCTSDGSGALICNTNLPVSSITAGTGLTGGTITSTGTIAVDVGTTANKIVQLDGSARLPAVDASQVTGLTSLQIPSLDAAKITTGTFAASQIPNLDWSKITTGKPTTISGYGITNAVTNAGSVISMQSGLDASKGSATTAGRLYVATDTAKVYYDTGSAWTQVASNTGTGGTVTSVSGSGPISVSNGTTTPSISIATANGSTTGALSSTDWTTFNNKLGTSLTSGQLFVGNASNVATGVTLSGDATITNAGVLTVSKIQNRTIAATAPSNGQILKWNNTNSQWEPASDAGLTSETDPSVNALGKATLSCSTNQIAKWNGTSWVCAADADTTYTAGTGLSLSGTTFNISTVPVANGGTGATTPAGARTNLGITATGDSLATATSAANARSAISAAGSGANADITSMTQNVDFSSTGAIKVPSGTTAQQPGSPSNGMIRYNADNNAIEARINGAWSNIATTSQIPNNTNFVDLTSNQTVAGNKTLSGNTSVGGTLGVTGAATLSSTLAVNGNVNVNSGKFFVDATNTRIGVGTAAPNATSLMDLTSTTSGFLMPRMTTTQRDAIATPATGLQVYNTTTNQINYYNGSAWQALGVSGAGVQSITAGTGLTGGTITSTGTVAVDVGTTANKIVQLDGSARLPAVNASLLTGLTASQIPSLDAAKITTGTFTASQIPSLDAAKISTGTIPIARGGTNSGTTLNNNRVMISSSGAIVESPAITASRAIASDANGLPVASTTSATELGYLTGVTSAVQTQLNAKASSSGWTNYSVITSNGSGALTAVAGSSAGQMLNWTVTGPVWTTATFPTSTTANQLLYSSANNVVGGLTTANNAILTTNGSGVPSWTALSGDAFTQYALLAGRSGGQTINGGTAASNNLTLDSTSNATKGNIILNPTGGNVGIGTTVPLARLDVAGASEWPIRLSLDSTTATARTHFLTARSRAGGAVASGDTLGGFAMGGKYDTSNFAYGWNGGAEVSAFASEAWTSSSRGSDLAFLTTPNGGTGSFERVRILNNGNVGIGTTTPAAKLQVAGSIQFGASATATNNWHFTNEAGDGKLTLWNGNYGSGNRRIDITSSGNVGLGTVSPTASLHLKAGTATASTAPLKFTAGTNLTTPEAGAIEFDGTNLYFTDSTNVRRTIATSSSAITGVTAGTGLSGGGTSGNVTLNLANVGTAGTYAKVTTDAQGRVTSGTTLSASDIPSLDASKITSGTLGVANGGTGATSASAARTALGLGTVSTLNTGVASGNVPVIGTSGITNNRMCTSDGSGALICNTSIPSASQWTTTGSDVYYSTGKVGVGTTSPQATLDVNGTIRMARNSSAPATCNSTIAGTMAMTNGYTLCVCNGSSWVSTSNGSSACSWSGAPITGASCKAIRDQGVTTSGIYSLTIGGNTFNAYCDMTTDGGGWTRVIMARGWIRYDNSKWNSNGVDDVTGSSVTAGQFLLGPAYHLITSISDLMISDPDNSSNWVTIKSLSISNSLLTVLGPNRNNGGAGGRSMSIAVNNATQVSSSGSFGFGNPEGFLYLNACNGQGQSLDGDECGKIGPKITGFGDTSWHAIGELWDNNSHRSSSRSSYFIGPQFNDSTYLDRAIVLWVR